MKDNNLKLNENAETIEAVHTHTHTGILLNNEKNEGITLISLVVTIIILLILAGISISMLTGENRNFKSSGRSKRKNRIINIERRAKII